MSGYKSQILIYLTEERNLFLTKCPFQSHRPEIITNGTKTNLVANAALGISATGP